MNKKRLLDITDYTVDYTETGAVWRRINPPVGGENEVITVEYTPARLSWWAWLRNLLGV